MVRLVGFEPTTYGLEVRCSIQLSYRRAKNYVFAKGDLLKEIYPTINPLDLPYQGEAYIGPTPSTP